MKFLNVQNGQRHNRVFAAIGAELPARVYPEHVPKLKKKKKKTVKPSSDEEEDEVEIDDQEIADGVNDHDDNDEGEINKENEDDDRGEEENSNSDDDSDSSSSDSSSDSSSAESSKDIPPPTDLGGQKRKKPSSSPLPNPNLKRVQIVDVNDDELDDGEIRIGAPILSVTPIRADASYAITDGNTGRQDVPASAATVAVENVQAKNTCNPVRATSPVRASSRVIDPKTHLGVDESVRVENIPKASEPSSPPFISTPSPELIKDVLSGFSERCAREGHWLMGLPNFNELEESSNHGKSFV